MKPFKLSYRVALASALAASTGSLAAGWLFNQCRRSCGYTPLSPSTLAILSLSAGSAFAALYFPPYSRRLRTTHDVYLTFDDGPDSVATPLILDALATRGAHATFFLIGEAAARQPHIVKRMAESGHALGIHGFHHHPITFQNAAHIGRDLDCALAAIRAATGASAALLYRPPYGLRGPGLARALRRRGLRMQLWTLDTHDYLSRSPTLIRQRLAAHLQPGDIVVLHDEGETGRATALAIPAILDDIAARGWKAVALPKDA